MKSESTWIRKSEILQRYQSNGQSWSTRDFHQVLCMSLPLVLCSHLSTLILSHFCSSRFYISALHSVLLCLFPVIFHTNLYNRNLFSLFSFLLQIWFTHFHRQNRTKKKKNHITWRFNFISWSIHTSCFLSPGTSLALISTETYLFRRRILHILEIASTPGSVEMVNKDIKK